MIISFTSSIPTAEQAAQIESFLAEFLPRMREIDGVEGIDPDLAWGDDDGLTLYVTAITSIYRIRLDNNHTNKRGD